MTGAPEKIKAWPWNGKTFSGQWHVDGQGVTTEYIRADLHAAALDREAALMAEVERLNAKIADMSSFDRADWFWRTMDPDDCGDSPMEAINRAMVGRFCVCEISASFSFPTRYGFIAPVLDPESDEEEFVHFATHEEAIEAAKARAAFKGATK